MVRMVDLRGHVSGSFKYAPSAITNQEHTPSTEMHFVLSHRNLQKLSFILNGSNFKQNNIQRDKCNTDKFYGPMENNFANDVVNVNFTDYKI